MIDRACYGQIVSLGRACQPAYQLRRLTGSDSAHVFDWIITTDAGLIHWIESDLRGFFARDRLVADQSGVVIDEATETQFVHEFPPEAEFDAAYEANSGRFAMLVDRWRDLMASDQRVLFVRQHAWGNDARTSALRLRAAIAARAPRLRFDLLYLTPDEQGDWREPGIINRFLRQPEPYEWTGDNNAWGEVLGYPPPAAPMLGRRHVFICGLHRSGTSVLHDVLATHPDVTSFKETAAPRDEGQHLQSVIASDADLGGPGAFAFDARARLTEVDVPRYATRLATLRTEWAPLWDDRPIRVEKSPPNIVRTRFLQEVMPDARFVFIVRHPFAVALATLKWMRSKNVEEPIRHWLRAHHIMLEDARKLRRSVCVRYEDLVASADDTLSRIWPIMDAAPVSVDGAAFQDHNANYLAKAHHRFEFSSADRRLLAHFGYRLEAPFVETHRRFGW
jgi:hypothetical protein